MGSKLAAMFGVKTVLGFGGTTVFSGLIIIAIWLACGLLMRISFVGSFSRAVEKTIASFIPGYASYKAIAEEKLQHKARILPYTSALLKQEDCWQPAFVVEQGSSGSYVLFVPNVPDTNNGRVLIARPDQVRLVSSLSANELDMSLKKMGKDLLSKAEINKEAASA